MQERWEKGEQKGTEQVEMNVKETRREVGRPLRKLLQIPRQKLVRAELRSVALKM